MTNLSTLRPPKNSSSKKGKLFTRELASALALGGCEGAPGHLAWLGVTLGEERGFAHFSEGGIGTRGGAAGRIPPPGLWVQPQMFLNRSKPKRLLETSRPERNAA